MIGARERFQAAAELFLAARNVPADEVESMLQAACGGDAELLQEVRSLLENAQESQLFETLAGRLRPAVNRLRAIADERTRSSSGVELGDTDDSAEFELLESRIDQYELKERIGEGGFGQVWVAEQSEPLQRRVAIKVIKPGMDSREVLRRFEIERQALALMEHPHIAKVYDAGTTQRGRPYFVMEYVPGLSITRFCDSMKLSIRDRLSLFGDVCDAVQHAHHRGVIHRDLKPSNVLVTLADGRPNPKVIDFGVAKAAVIRGSNRSIVTEMGRMIGTPAYMSPEQAGSAGVDIDTRSDVYSLGVILYQLLTGTTPIDQEMLRQSDFGAVTRIIREWDPPSPSTRLSDMLGAPTSKTEYTPQEIAQSHGTDVTTLQRTLRGELDWIVMKCLEKERGRRYDSVHELSSDIRRYLAGDRVVAAPPSTWYAFRKFVRRHRLLLAAAGCVMIALVAGLGASTFFYVQEREARTRAVDAEAAQTVLRIDADEARAAEAEQRQAAEAERDRAKMEAAKADRINKFLNDMLSAIQPDRAQGRDVTVRETLDDAASRIEAGELRDEPEVQAAIHATIGSAYTSLARYEEAEEHLNAALAEREALLGVDHPQVADSLLGLAALRYYQGNLEATDGLARRALAIRLKHADEDQEELARARHLLAETCAVRGKFDEAEALFEMVLRFRQSPGRPEDLRLVETLSEWGSVRNSRGDYAQAEKMWREALAVGLRVAGEDNTTISMCYNNLATLAYMRGDYPTAIENYERTVRIRRKLLSPDHPDLASSIRNLGTAYFGSGKLDEAERYYCEALAIQRRVLGPQNPLIANTLEGLAASFRIKNQLDEAESLQREALEIRQATFGAEHPLVAQAMYFLGLVLSEKKEHAEAESVLRQSLAMRRKTLASDDWVVAENIVCLGRARRFHGDFVDAEQLDREALALGRKLGGESHPRVAAVLNELALVRDLSGDADEAERLFREALAILRGRNMAAHRDAGNVMYNLALLVQRLGDRDEARDLLEQAVTVFESALPAGHPLLLGAQQALNALDAEAVDSQP